MIYTKDTPTQPGWYWLRDLEGEQVVNVIKRPGHSFLAIQAISTNMRHYTPVKEVDVHWAGPLKAPTYEGDYEDETQHV